MGLLQGKVAVVTGATSGVGRSAAALFAREGAKVMFVGRRHTEGQEVEGEIRADGGDATFLRTDVRVSEEVQQMVTATVAKYGPIDIAFNNAGVGSEGVALAATTDTEFDNIIGTNLKAAFLCLKHQIPFLRTPGASIIFTGSIAAAVGAPMRAIYSASKAGLNALTRAAAMELAPLGVRVNTINPAGIRTALSQAFFDRSAIRLGSMRAALDEVNARYPIGRIAEAEDIANVALFLASDLSAMITGQSLAVDGGQSVGRVGP